MTTNDFLLDTHTFLWAITANTKLSQTASEHFLNQDNRLWLSVASIWEVAIKSSLGRIQFRLPLSDFLDDQLHRNAIVVMDIKRAHAEVVEHLPFHHQDPFDRLLVAQSVYENMPILSADCQLDSYEGLQRIW